jgi:endonuclease/exonuclease/phosphatase family metal-dependent hydrolase
VDKPYDAAGTYTTVIDYFLLSPNIELTHVNGIADGFAYSDHQPVRMSFRLK